MSLELQAEENTEGHDVSHQEIRALAVRTIAWGQLLSRRSESNSITEGTSHQPLPAVNVLGRRVGQTILSYLQECRRLQIA